MIHQVLQNMFLMQIHLRFQGLYYDDLSQEKFCIPLVNQLHPQQLEYLL